MYQHQPPQEMTHMPGFGNVNPPPPPIPMPQTHPTNLQFSPPNPNAFQQQLPQQTPTFEQMSQQESLGPQKEEMHVCIFFLTADYKKI